MSRRKKNPRLYYGQSAASLLVHAYAKVTSDGGSVNWDDINAAHEQARAELGAKRCRAIAKLYYEDGVSGKRSGSQSTRATRSPKRRRRASSSRL